jgi:hypothetical protein
MTSSAPRPSARRLWLALPSAERKAIALELAHLKGGESWPILEPALAVAMGFRVATLRKANEEQLARWIGEAAGRLPDELLERMLVAVHFQGRAKVLESVYEAFGIERDGLEVAEEVLATPLDPEKSAAAIAALAAKGDATPIRTCLSVMRLACTEEWRPAVEASLARIEAEPTA